jgi:nucleoside-diphosphate-sugar epimerase
MRVFVTGASGFVGSAVVKELISAGHQVIGLARSESSAKSVAAAGAEVHWGSLEDHESLKAGAAKADGVIHTAFIHDFSNFAKCCETDRLALETLGDVLAGSGKPFVVTSGTMMHILGRLATEEDATNKENPMTALRSASDAVALSYAAHDVRVSVIRLPPSVHGETDHGFVPQLINAAREKGVSAYVGDGQNRWPTVHRLDAARVYRLALEKGSAGSKFHAVAEEGVPVKSIAEVIGRHLNVPVVSKSFEEAQVHFGFLALPLSGDNPTSSKQTQEQLGWHSSEVELIPDIEQGHYFKV